MTTRTTAAETTDKTQLRTETFIPTGVEVSAQLERIVSNPDFTKATRLREFLRFVVNEELNGRTDSLKAYTIGVEVFDRPENFDPITDTIVRVNAGKLRRTLERYYLVQGRLDRIHISIPKGRYVPLFQIRELEPAKEDVISDKMACKPLSPATIPTVAVLPFRKISIEASREFIINGFGEELTMALSRFSGLNVLAYYSTSLLTPAQSSPDQLRCSHSAVFVLTGSIYQTADKLRLNVELLRTDNSQQVWSHCYDRKFTADTLFSTRDEIVQNIVAMVADDYGIIPKVIAVESQRKSVDALDGHEAVMRYHHYFITLDPLDFEEALYALEKAVAFDPEHALAWALLSILYLDAFIFSYRELKNPLERGMETARKAIAVDPFCQHAYWAMCYVQMQHRNEEEVVRNANKIIELNPNAGSLVSIAGWNLALTGQFEKGFQILGQGMQLSPFVPSWFFFPYYVHHYLEGKYDDALESQKKFGLPDFFWNPLMRAAALGQLGRITEAETALQRLLSLKPDFPEKARFYISCFLIKDEWVDSMLEGLEKAGLKGT